MKQINILSLLFVILSVPLFSGVSGTISGQVTDAASGEPIVGVQVILDGSARGAVTDNEGVYLLINIPPGNYDLRFEMIGYGKRVVTGVPVLVDLHTEINAQLATATIEGETVVVESEARDLSHQVTATTRFISPDQLEKLPVLNYQELIESQPGVVAGHVRGGRKSEVVYLVDGIPIQNVIDGKVGGELPNTSIIDISVQTGGFAAEYGNAMSGVVNILTKEGKDKFFLKTQAHLMDYTADPRPFDSPGAPYEYKLDMAMGGPIPFVGGSYFVSGDANLPSTRTIHEQFGVRKVVITDPDSSWNFNLSAKLNTFLFDNKVKLSLQNLYSGWEWREYDHLWKYNLGALPKQTKYSNRVATVLSHTLTPKTYYELNFSYYRFLRSIIGSSTDLLNAVPVESDSGYVIAGIYPWWMDHQETHIYSKFTTTTQMTEDLQFRGGMSLTQYQLYRRNVHRKDIKDWSYGFPVYIAYDIEYEYEPRRGDAFAQLKYEQGSLVINAGLRYDFFDPRADRPQIEIDYTELDDDWIIDTVSTSPASVKTSVSPRVGIAWVVGNNAKFHFNYGHFFQMPSFDYLYTNSDLNIANGFSALGDADLKPAQTRALEFGYIQPFGDWGMVDVVLFTKDVVNLIDSNTLLVYQDNYQKEGFTRFVNIGKSAIQGLELYVEGSLSEKFTANLAYTMMTAVGTSSYSLEGLHRIFELTTRGTKFYPLSWDQRHTAVINLEWAPLVWFSTNLAYHYNSGFPFTLDKREYTVPNDARMDPTHQVDFRVNLSRKGNSISKMNAFFEITNVLNEQNVLWVDSQGYPGGSLHDPSAYDLSRRIRIGLGLEL
ncbi:MAG: TonB-dependent receptor [Candidatus Marinimicrobia bacterium]|nr:TonB-dependent receptor [Candidatus Neomarinimicrobiota bacterium]